MVEPELVGEGGIDAAPDERPHDVVRQPWVPGPVALLDPEPRLDRSEELIAHPDAQLWEVLEEEVREVLVGHDHHRGDGEDLELPTQPGESVEERHPLRLGRRVAGCEHHRCVRGAGGHHELRHGTSTGSVSVAAPASSAR